jgi:hypothetical protein
MRLVEGEGPMKNRDHVVVRTMRSVTEVPEVKGLIPLECRACKETVYLGLPISIGAMATLTQAFANSHENCTEEQ